VRIGFTLRDGWFDLFESEAHRWQGCTEGSPESDLGKRAMRIITACRVRFGLADRLAERGRRAAGLERAKELLRRALPCTSEEVDPARAMADLQALIASRKGFVSAVSAGATVARLRASCSASSIPITRLALS
jgi:hypothetical protein